MLKLFSLNAIIFLVVTYSTNAHAAPVRVEQILSKPNSSIKFGVQSPSPTLQMNGEFTRFSGKLVLNPTNVEDSTVSLMLDLRSLQLPPDQLIQTIFAQTALAQVKQPEPIFTSDSISRISGSRYSVAGMYTWQGKKKPTQFPIEILKASQSESIIKVALNGDTKNKDAPPELGGMEIAGSRGWAKGVLVFRSK